MTTDDRINELEGRIDQLQRANEKMFALLFLLATESRWRETIESTADAAAWLRMIAVGQDDQQNHAAASTLSRVADVLVVGI